MTLIGAPVRRVEDERLLTGRGRFAGDMVVPGMLHAAFLRSIHAIDFPALARGKVRFTGEAVTAALGGFKGVGGGGTIGAPAAVANAVADALAPPGIDITELPMTPDRLFRLIHQREKRETP